MHRRGKISRNGSVEGTRSRRSEEHVGIRVMQKMPGKRREPGERNTIDDSLYCLWNINGKERREEKKTYQIYS